MANTTILIDSHIEDKLSLLIEDQFPAFYHEEGPVFIEFVKHYFQWLETQAKVRKAYFCEDKYSLRLEAGNNVIIGNNSLFLTQFANGDQIAICRGVGNSYQRTASTNDYEIFTIDTIANNTYLTLTTDKLPEYSHRKIRYGQVKTQKNPVYYGRNFFNIKDIDDTFDEFLIYFKEKYLKNIELETLVDTRRLVKHSLDIYRSKGTPRQIDLLFRMIYGFAPNIYYPRRDIFRSSSGKWKKPTYLEIDLKERSTELVGKQIYGLTSGATAFCESVVRRTVAGKMIDVMYITNISGNFITGEIINTRNVPLPLEETPTIIGSLTAVDVDVIGVGENYNIGDIVDISSTFGRQAKARVAATSNSFGAVTITLANGGYGYTENAHILISNTMVKLSNVSVDLIQNDGNNYFYYFFDDLIQPTAIINYISASGNLETNSFIYTYHGNNDLKGSGRILSKTAINSTAGEITISVLSGNMESSRFYTTGNSIYANQAASNGYTNTTAFGNVMGVASNVEINYSGISNGSFIAGERLTNANGSVQAYFVSAYNVLGTSGTIVTSNIRGVFVGNTVLYGVNSGAYANIDSVNMYVGLVNVSNTHNFITLEHNYTYSSNANTIGTVTFVGEGERAGFSIANSLSYTENIEINDDYIWDHRAVELDAAAWPLFTAYPTANITNGTIEQILSYSNTIIGKISSIVAVDRGLNYNHMPLIKIYEPKTAPFLKNDIIKISINTPSGLFLPGELITQEASNARGIVLPESNSSILCLQTMRFYANNDFVITSNSTTVLFGENSGSEANAISITIDANSGVYGLDARISTSLAISNGAITRLSLLDSGFGFVNGEIVTISSNGVNTAVGVARVQTHGTGNGYFYEKGGVLSGDKHLFDGYYYQEYSYEIRSSLTLNKYEKMLKSLAHVAGFQLFGALYYDGIMEANVSVSTSISQNGAVNVLIDRPGAAIITRNDEWILNE